MATRVFLGLSVLVWLPYGLYCLVQPGSLAEAAGVTAVSATASTELRAMYGGLQSAIGALALAALLRPGLGRAALVCLFCLCAGLGSGRLVGVALDGGVSSYTALALVFEFGSAAVAAWLLARAPGDVHAT
jgi:hypothetical protein